jgi:hypothetical protein
MDRPIHLVVALSGLFSGAALLNSAEEANASAAANAATRQRLVSPHVAQMLTEVAARQPAPVAEPAVKEVTAESAARQRVAVEARDVPANGIVRLPDYIVRDRKVKLPTPQDVMTEQELARYAVRKYFSDGHEFWGRIDLGAVWQTIPILGRILPLMSIEQRAMERYQDERYRERWSDAMSLLSPADRERVKHPDRPPPSK